jgi:hypothetical protein
MSLSVPWRIAAGNSLSGTTPLLDDAGGAVTLADGGWTIRVTAYPLGAHGDADYSAGVVATVTLATTSAQWTFGPGAIAMPGSWVVDVVAEATGQHRSRLWPLVVTPGPPVSS